MRFQRKQHLRTSVFDTEAKGFGVFLFDGASAGDFVMEYVGEVLPFAAYAKRKHFYDRRNFQHAYFMRLSADEVIDATRCGNIARFINHSCSPNLETQKWAVGGEMCIGLFALRNIQPGEELSFDYNFQSFGDRPMQCLCRSFNCRKWIGGGGEDTESVHCDSSDNDDEQDDVDDGQRDEVEDDSDDQSDDENDEDFVVCSAQRHIGWHGEQSLSNDKYGWSGCRRKNERSCGSGTRVRTRKMRLPMRKPLSKNAKASCDEERNAYQERSSLREANHTVAATTATQQVQTICGKNLGGCISRSRGALDLFHQLELGQSASIK
jgi:SET domain-containing protein